MSRVNVRTAKFRVRNTALLLKSFTLEEIVESTGYSKSTVRAELWRMKREGYLTSEEDPTDERFSGQRRHKYTLIDDPEKRLELSRSLY